MQLEKRSELPMRGLVWLACSGIMSKRIVVPVTNIRNMVPFAK